MESDHEELYLHKLQEFVCDEDKIITANSLSRELNLDVTLCKSLMKTFLADQKAISSPDLGVTYVLQGILKENGQKTVSIVKGSELNNKKALFEEVISETVHSIQKSTQIDLNLIASMDIFNIQTPSKFFIGGLISEDYIKRNIKAREKLPEIQRNNSVDKSKASHLFAGVVPKTEIKSETKVNGTTDKDIKDVKDKTQETKKPQKKTEVKHKTTVKNGLSSFLVKGGSKSNLETKPTKKEETKEIKEKIIDTKEEPMEIDDDEDEVAPAAKEKSTLYDSGTDEEAKKVEEKNKKLETQTPKPKKKPASKRQRKDNNSDQVTKRRKRIIQRIDSDSDDDMFGNSRAEIVESSSDEEPVVKKTPAPLPPKNKRRKCVDKTYIDDEGFLVTTKEWIQESASEDEEEKEQKNPQIQKTEEMPVKEKPTENSKKAKDPSPPNKSNGKGKKNAAEVKNQPSIMSFFKKK